MVSFPYTLIILSLYQKFIPPGEIMRKFILFTLIFSVFAVLHVYVMEKTDYFHLQEKTAWHISFSEEEGQMTMHWERLPYPSLYRIEAFSKTTGLVAGGAPYHLFYTDITLRPQQSLPKTAIPMYYQITAYGLFGRLTSPMEPAPNPNYTDPPSPVIIRHYTEEHPASRKPYLLWHTVPKAVCYEVEFFSAPPENEEATDPSTLSPLARYDKIFTNGWQADLDELRLPDRLYWRVRALDLTRRPIGVFSKAEALVADASLPVPDRPLLNDFDQMPGEDVPLYPVYQWIPMHGVDRYEVELCVTPPKEEYDTVPTPDRAWHMVVTDSFSCYDEYPRPYAGAYYWRVRGIDEAGRTVGRYSDAAQFVVPERRQRPFAAAFGDSITHGGGALSYSPFNLEYNYTTYLDFPAANLGRSGDTAHTSRLRFDEDVLPYHPHNLLILTGSNDLRADLSAAAIIEDLDAIGKKCRQNDIRPIFLTLMPLDPANIERAFHTETDENWPKKLRTINDFIRQQEYYIDLEPYFYDPTGMLLNPDLSIDGLHPDIRGKMLMAEIINAHPDQFR